jgi:hypothetical protein
MRDMLLARARKLQELLMVSSCVVEETTEGAFNPATGDHATGTLQHYAGACRIRSAWDFVERPAGDAEQRVNRPALVLPHGAAPALKPGWTVTVSGEAAGTYTIAGVLRLASTASADAYLIEKVTD